MDSETFYALAGWSSSKWTEQLPELVSKANKELKRPVLFWEIVEYVINRMIIPGMEAKKAGNIQIEQIKQDFPSKECLKNFHIKLLLSARRQHIHSISLKDVMGASKRLLFDGSENWILERFQKYLDGLPEDFILNKKQNASDLFLFFTKKDLAYVKDMPAEGTKKDVLVERFVWWFFDPAKNKKYYAAYTLDKSNWDELRKKLTQ